MISDQFSCYDSMLSQHQRRDNSHNGKANDLDRHVAADINRREAVPVPIGNVGRDGGQDSGNKYEADSAGEARDARLSENASSFFVFR